MKEIKTNNQVEVILYKRLENGKIVFLMLKRSKSRGGFWQPITGNVKPHESFKDAALREIREETKIEHHLDFIDTGYSFDFEDDDREQHEKVFGIEVGIDEEVILSAEHTECVWVEKNEALNRLLKYPGNKAGLTKLSQILFSRR